MLFISKQQATQSRVVFSASDGERYVEVVMFFYQLSRVVSLERTVQSSALDVFFIGFIFKKFN